MYAVRQSLKPTVWLITLVGCLFLSLSLFANETIIKSPNDNRDYRVITLPNDLEVLLISDPESDKAAASMNVAIGSAANPKGREGLAHFLEHMLFLGTEKYPEAEEYQAFIQSHGGTHNAFTALENTNYFFDINANDLAPALDRFSQFFIAPLFSEAYTQRERNAVHSEYRAKIRDDGRRSYAATQQILNPDHPASQFAVGNLDTLNNDNGQLRNDVVTFYQTYYSANQMKLAILGHESLNQLADLAQRYFGAIPNKSLPDFKITAPRYKADQLPLLLKVQTLKEEYGLSMTFPMPDAKSAWQTKPISLISGMVGYEGEGSLLALLKQKGWANSLGASPGQSIEDETSFNVYIGLTQKGYQHTDDLVALFFSYMASLNNQGISPALFEEEKLLNEQAFRYLDEREPIHYVTQLSQSMQDRFYPTLNLLDAGYRLDQYDPKLINSYIDLITPQNMVLVVQANDISTDQTAPYYETPYSASPIPQVKVKNWQQAKQSSALFVRHTNPFIADDLNVKQIQHQSQVPIELPTGIEGVHLWHLQNQEFNVPKADVWFTLLTPIAREGAEATVGLRLYTDMVNEQLNKVLYDASMAGLSTQIYPHARGISVRISGFSQKIDRLLAPVINALRHPEMSDERFLRVQQDLIQSLSNADKETPYNQLFGHIYDFLLSDASPQEQSIAASGYTLKKLQQLVDRLYTSLEVRVLANGNLLANEAQEMTQTLYTGLAPTTTGNVAPQTPVLKIQENEQFTLTVPIKHRDQAVVEYLQASGDSDASNAANILLSEVFSAPFYSQLRTEQQLGYIVFSSPMTIRQQPGMALVVQSPSVGTKTIKERMDTFINQFKEQLAHMDQPTFKRFKASVLARINDQDRQLSDSTNRFWRSIDDQELNFDSRKRLSAAIQSLKIADLQEAYEQMIGRRLIIETAGDKAK